MAKRKNNVSKGRIIRKKLPKPKARASNTSTTEKKKLQEELYKLLLEEERKAKTTRKKKPKRAVFIDELYKDFNALFEEERKAKTTRKKKPKRAVFIGELYKDFNALFEEEEKKHKPKRKPRELTKKEIDSLEEEELSEQAYREEERLRYKGQFISEEFEKIIRAAAGASKKTAEELLSDPANSKALDNILNKNKSTANKTANTIIERITGKHVIEVTDGNETWFLTDKEAIQRIVSFDSRVKRNEEGVVYVGIQIEEYLNGRTVIYLPRKRASAEELQEFLDDYTEYIIYSDDNSHK